MQRERAANETGRDENSAVDGRSIPNRRDHLVRGRTVRLPGGILRQLERLHGLPGRQRRGAIDFGPVTDARGISRIQAAERQTEPGIPRLARTMPATTATRMEPARRDRPL